MVTTVKWDPVFLAEYDPKIYYFDVFILCVDLKLKNLVL